MPCLLPCSCPTTPAHSTHTHLQRQLHDAKHLFLISLAASRLLQLPYHTSGPSCLTQEQLEQLCKLTGLESLTLELDSAISAAAFKHITKLKGLSSLVLHGVASPPLLGKLGQLRRLRRLAVTVAVSAATGWPEELQELEAVEQIDLGWVVVVGCKCEQCDSSQGDAVASANTHAALPVVVASQRVQVILLAQCLRMCSSRHSSPAAVYTAAAILCPAPAACTTPAPQSWCTGCPASTATSQASAQS